jgi:hypothetical protein
VLPSAWRLAADISHQHSRLRGFDLDKLSRLNVTEAAFATSH